MELEVQTHGDQTYIYAKKASHKKAKDTRKQLLPEASTSEAKNEEKQNLAKGKQNVLDRAKDKKVKKKAEVKPKERQANVDKAVPEKKKKTKLPTPRVRLLPVADSTALKVRHSVASLLVKVHKSQQTTARGLRSHRKTTDQEVQVNALDVNQISMDVPAVLEIIADVTEPNTQSLDASATNADLKAEELEIPDLPPPPPRVVDDPFKAWALLLIQLGQKNLTLLFSFVAVIGCAFFAGKYLGENSMPKPPDSLWSLLKLFFWPD